MTTADIHTDSTGSYIKLAKDAEGNWPELIITNLLMKRAMNDGQAPMNCYNFMDEVGYLTAGATVKADIPTTWATPAYTGGENHSGSFTTSPGHNPLLSVAPAASNPPTLTVTNSLNPGSLQLIKAIAEGAQANNEAFTFQVVLTPPTGVTIDPNALTLASGDDGAITAATANGVTTLTVHINNVNVTADTTARTKAVTINGIPAGTTYEVTEPIGNLPAGWHQTGEVVYSDPGKTVAANETTDRVTITNTRSGDIKLKKIVTLSGSDVPEGNTALDGSFTFTIVGTAETATADISKTVVITLANGTYTAMIADTGSPTETTPLAVGQGGYFTISDLPLGDYTITENSADRAGYNLATSFAVNGTSTTDNPVTVTLGSTTVTATVEATNAYTPGAELPATGGPGITLYTILGTLLISAAGILLLLKKRKYTN